MRFSSSRDREGTFIALSLIVLVVFAALGVVMMFSGSSEYSMSVRSAYRIKAEAHMHAAFEEALRVVYDNVNAPDLDYSDGVDEPAWKKELIEAVRNAVDGGETGVVLEKDLLASNLIPNTMALVSEDGGSIDECKVEFRGFRKLYYTPNGFFAEPDKQKKVYYTDPNGVFDKDPKYPCDYVGYFVIKIRSSYGTGVNRVVRDLTTTHDIKIVNVSPLAREFVFYAMYPSPDTAYAERALNTGGALKIFPRTRGRVFVLGPYIVDSEGIPDGTGGYKAPKNECMSYWSRNWAKWSLIPLPRAGVMSRAGILFASVAFPPARPNNKSGIIILPTILGLKYGQILRMDPGFFLAQSKTEWYCSSIDRFPGNSGFCLIGDPTGSDSDYKRDMYRGIKFKYKKGGGREVLGEFAEGTDYGSHGKSMVVIQPEGALVSKFKGVQYSRMEFPITIMIGWVPVTFTAIRYKVKTTSDSVYMPYGVYWMKEIKQNWLSFFGENLLSAAMGLLVMGTLGNAGSTALGEVVSKVGLEFGQGVMALAGLALAGGIIETLTDNGYNFNAPGVDPGRFENAFYPGYKNWGRAATRVYDSIEEMDFYTTDRDSCPMILDGTIVLKDFSNEGFKYVGRGTLMGVDYLGAEDPSSSGPPSVSGPIFPLNEPRKLPEGGLSLESHLNIVYYGQAKDAYRGDWMLTLDDAGGTGQPLVASVFASSGVKPGDGQRVIIAGNYVSGYPNKFRIPPDARLDVVYNPAYSPKNAAEAEKFLSPEWYDASVSFRCCGWYGERRSE